MLSKIVCPNSNYTDKQLTFQHVVNTQRLLTTFSSIFGEAEVTLHIEDSLKSWDPLLSGNRVLEAIRKDHYTSR